MAPNMMRLGEPLALFDMQRSSVLFFFFLDGAQGCVRVLDLALNYDEVKRCSDLSLLMYLLCIRLRAASCG